MVARAVIIIDRTHAPQLPALYVARFRIEPAQIISATRTSEVDRDSKARKIVEGLKRKFALLEPALHQP
jgi:hypothetical protein